MLLVMIQRVVSSMFWPTGSATASTKGCGAPAPTATTVAPGAVSTRAGPLSDGKGSGRFSKSMAVRRLCPAMLTMPRYVPTTRLALAS